MIWVVVGSIAFCFVLDGLRGIVVLLVWATAGLVVSFTGSKGAMQGSGLGTILGILIGPVIGGVYGHDTFLGGEPSIGLMIAHYLGAAFGQEVIGGLMLGMLSGTILGAVIGRITEALSAERGNKHPGVLSNTWKKELREQIERAGQGDVVEFGATLKRTEGVWLAKKAEQGDADAQFEIARMFEQGRVVAKDKVKAFALYDLAASSEHEEAKCSRDELRKGMSVDQVTEAQKLSDKLSVEMKGGSD